MKICPRCGNSTLRKLANTNNLKTTVAYICPCGYESVKKLVLVTQEMGIIKEMIDYKYGATHRGFPLVEFKDIYGEECSLQLSSLATIDAIWLGCNECTEVDGRVLSPRMHLDEDSVRKLVDVLNYWLENKDFPNEQL